MLYFSRGSVVPVLALQSQTKILQHTWTPELCCSKPVKSHALSVKLAYLRSISRCHAYG